MTPSIIRPAPMYQEPATAEPPPAPDLVPPEADGPPPALDALFIAEESRLLGFAMTLTANDFSAAQDLVQEAFLRLHRQGLAGVTSPRAWLITVIRRLAADRRKKRTESPLPEHHDTADTETPAAPERLEHAEQIARLRLHLGDLPVRDRELIRLKFTEELDYAAIADLTGLSVGNVGYRLHHLVKKLAALMRADADTDE